MHLDAARVQLLTEIVRDLAAAPATTESRRVLGEQLLRLLRADQFASFVWSPVTGAFENGVTINMSAANLTAYQRHYQYNDPITMPLREFRRATFVEEVLSRDELRATEFYNDFLARDGLHHGLNYFAWSGTQNVGDLRVWRSRERADFDEQDRSILELIGQAFTANAVRGIADSTASITGGTLTLREAEVARAAARGHTDAEIAATLRMSVATVRTHLRHCYEKLQVRNRTELARLLPHR